MPDPDFKGFTDAVMENWYEHHDLDAGDRFELAVKFNIVRAIPGGFDPETHDDEFGDIQPGDPWYELNYVPNPETNKELPMSKGNRNNALTAFAIAMIDRGDDAETVRMKVRDLNAQFRDPLPETEIAMTLDQLINRRATS